MKCICYVHNIKINKRIIMCYTNHSQVLVSKYLFFQVTDVFITGCGHQIFKFRNVTQIQGIIIWCRCVTEYGHRCGHSLCGIECSCMHKCLSWISSLSQRSSSSEIVWKFSSSSSSSRLTYALKVYLEDGCCKASAWYCTCGVLSGDGISSVGVSSSSSEKL